MTAETTSFNDLFEPPTEPVESPQVDAPAKRGARRPAERSVRPDELAIGAYPIAHLLPPEVIAQGKVKTTRVLMSVVVVAVLLLGAAAVGGAYALRLSAQNQLQSVQDRNASVLAQEAKYAPARTAQNKVKLAQAAQRVGAATEVDWNAMFGKINAALPAGVTITDISGQTGNPMGAVTQDSTPLAVGRGAIVMVTVSAPDAQSVAAAADAFQKIAGVDGVGVGAVTQGTSQGAATASTAAAWSAPITISLSQAAFSGRFAQ
ncbi:MAG: hypothetical protein FWD85_12960 [Microbacteriaceae bacterium]|nr:hypothetical protein [Microbacteriaceae bacterium]